MQAGLKVGIFLKQKIQENKLSRIDLSEKTGVANDSINLIYYKKQNNVSLKTVLKLANYFNCSTDEVLGRTSFINSDNKNYLLVTAEEAMNNVKSFIKVKFEESNMENITKFSKSCRFDQGAIRKLINENRKPPNIFLNNILIIADHFNISIDELVGRIRIPSLLKEEK